MNESRYKKVKIKNKYSITPKLFYNESVYYLKNHNLVEKELIIMKKEKFFDLKYKLIFTFYFFLNLIFKPKEDVQLNYFSFESIKDYNKAQNKAQNNFLYLLILLWKQKKFKTKEMRKISFQNLDYDLRKYLTKKYNL